MSAYLSPELRMRLEDVDDHCCAYCQTTTANTGQPMTVDHIIPEVRGGLTAFENLCFCCRRCNEFKAAQTQVKDPLTGEYVALYHPRQQRWHDHFMWDEAGMIIIGLTAVGRATILGLYMNNAVIVAARRRWVSVGWHPPTYKHQSLI